MEFPKRQLRENWRDVLRQSWTLRVGLFWSALSGIWNFWPAAQELVPWPYFLAGSIALPVALFLARITKQPGSDI